MPSSTRSLFLCALLAGGMVGLSIAEPSSAEREAITAYRQNAFVEQLRDIQESAGFAVPVEVDWESIALPGQAAHYGAEDYWTNVYFVPLAEALEMLTSYDQGKQAVQGKLKRVVVRYDASRAPADGYRDKVALDAGVLRINFKPASAAEEIEERTEAIQSALETAL